jgi:glutaminase
MSDPVSAALGELVTRLATVAGGAVADYIPELAHADPDAIGVALVSAEGHRYEAGDARVPFTVQSVSKPFAYALAVAELGLDEVTRHVGAEPSGEPFNAVSLEPGTGRPANPMVNAGAIATTALLPGPDRVDRVVRGLSAFAGRALDVDERVYASESATGDRNRALAYLMRASGALAEEPEAAVAAYFRQCAVRATARDLAVMAATLAAGGTNPVTGAEVVPATVAEQTLAVMASCGMYDAAGDWLLRVGLPAKSGVSGAIVAASPARFGIAVYAPPLDAAGNSVRGVAGLRDLSERFGLHLMHAPAPAAHPVVRAEPGFVAARGGLDFTAGERVLHALAAATPAVPGRLACDLTEVTRAEPVATAMLAAALRYRAAQGYDVALAGPALVEGFPPRFPTRAAALGWVRSG